MAIEIIERGEWPPAEKPKRAKCTRCQTVFTFMDEDCTGGFACNDGRLGSNVACPVCGHNVSYMNQPPKMRQRDDTRRCP